MESVHLKIRYPCSACPKNFSDEGYLKIHFKNVHAIDPTPASERNKQINTEDDTESTRCDYNINIKQDEDQEQESDGLIDGSDSETLFNSNNAIHSFLIKKEEDN